MLCILLGTTLALQLLADILLRERGYGDVELIAHITPQRTQHLLEESVTVLLAHILLGLVEALNGHLIGTTVTHQHRVTAIANLTAQDKVCHSRRDQNSEHGPEVCSAQHKRSPRDLQCGITQLDKADVAAQLTNALLRGTRDELCRRGGTTLSVGRYVEGQRC